MGAAYVREMQGLRHVSDVTTIAVINTPQLLYSFPVVTSQNVVSRTARITKINATGRGVATGFLLIGIGLGASWVQKLIDIDIIAGLQTILTEDEIPEYMFGEWDSATTITCQASILCKVQIEVEEYGP